MITNPNTIPSTYPILVDGVYFLMIPYRFWPDSHGCKNFSLVLVFEIGVPRFGDSIQFAEVVMAVVAMVVVVVAPRFADSIQIVEGLRTL